MSDLLGSGLEVSSKGILFSGLGSSVLLLAAANLRLWLLFVLPSSPDFHWHCAVFFLNSLPWASTLAYDYFGLWTLILDFNRPLSMLLFCSLNSGDLVLRCSVFLPLVTTVTAPDSCSHPKNLLVS